MRINEQIAFLRKEKGITQETLANALGVSNQAVSKWEASICCPDIVLLPDIAKYFGVSVDTLLGYNNQESKDDIFLKLKNMFSCLPSNEIFDTSFRIATLLHDAIVSNGYSKDAPYDINDNYADKEIKNKGFSSCSLPDGNTVYCENNVLVSYAKNYNSPSLVEQYQISLNLEKLLKPNVLQVMYALYDLTVNDFDLFVTTKEIADKAGMPESDTILALKDLPTTPKETNFDLAYRLDGGFMHIPSLLKVFNYWQQ